jgi:hypothetical protein
MRRKASCHPSDGANVDGTDVRVRDVIATAGGSNVPADGGDVSGSGVEVISGSSGATAGAADATRGAYASGRLLTGPVATHACQCVLSPR